MYFNLFLRVGVGAWQVIDIELNSAEFAICSDIMERPDGLH
jgi:hypothetical protein